MAITHLNVNSEMVRLHIRVEKHDTDGKLHGPGGLKQQRNPHEADHQSGNRPSLKPASHPPCAMTRETSSARRQKADR